jgi:hypothetical protein
MAIYMPIYASTSRQPYPGLHVCHEGPTVQQKNQSEVLPLGITTLFLKEEANSYASKYGIKQAMCSCIYKQ